MKSSMAEICRIWANPLIQQDHTHKKGRYQRPFLKMMQYYLKAALATSIIIFSVLVEYQAHHQQYRPGFHLV